MDGGKDGQMGNFSDVHLARRKWSLQRAFLKILCDKSLSDLKGGRFHTTALNLELEHSTLPIRLCLFI